VVGSFVTDGNPRNRPLQRYLAGMAPVHSSARADARPVPEVVWQYAWLHRRFGPEALFTTDGHAIQVIHPGQWNHDAGPDFLQAVVKLGELTFRGHVELHVAGSDWYAHGHHQDPAYNAVILHVVAEASAKRPLREDFPSVWSGTG